MWRGNKEEVGKCMEDRRGGGEGRGGGEMWRGNKEDGGQKRKRKWGGKRREEEVGGLKRREEEVGGLKRRWAGGMKCTCVCIRAQDSTEPLPAMSR